MPRPQKKTDAQILEQIKAQETQTVVGGAIRPLASVLGLSFEGTRKRINKLIAEDKVTNTQHGIITTTYGKRYLDSVNAVLAIVTEDAD